MGKIKEFFKKLFKKRIRYTRDILPKIETYSSDKASIFNEAIRDYQADGYEINKLDVCEGKFSFVAEMKGWVKLPKCLLEPNKVAENDVMLPTYQNHSKPSNCEFYISGSCNRCASKHGRHGCLYQDNEANRGVLERMVEYYAIENEKKGYDNNSQSFQDTKLGRVFSNQYDKIYYETYHLDKTIYPYKPF